MLTMPIAVQFSVPFSTLSCDYKSNDIDLNLSYPVFTLGRNTFSLIPTAVKRPRRFLFYLVGFYSILSRNMGKDV